MDQSGASGDGIPEVGVNQHQATVGEAPFAYEVHRDWARLPAGWEIGDVGGVAVDAADHVFVFNRSAHPMIIFDRRGEFVSSWGDDVFCRPHGLDIGPDGNVYCTDDGDHTVRKCSPDGRVLLEIGLPDKPSEPMSGKPFNRCTHTALSPTGEIYVSDGYQNARVHKFSPQGELILSWGSPGPLPGQFNLPHNICTDEIGRVYVADRENNRIQVFDDSGRLLQVWGELNRPCALCNSKAGQPRFYVGEVGGRGAGGGPPRLSVLDAGGQILSRVGRRSAGLDPDQFLAPHGMAVDSRGDLYVGEVAHRAWSLLHPDAPEPTGLTTFRKLVRRRD